MHPQTAKTKEYTPSFLLSGGANYLMLSKTLLAEVHTNLVTIIIVSQWQSQVGVLLFMCEYLCMHACVLAIDGFCDMHAEGFALYMFFSLAYYLFPRRQLIMYYVIII